MTRSGLVYSLVQHGQVRVFFPSTSGGLLGIASPLARANARPSSSALAADRFRHPRERATCFLNARLQFRVGLLPRQQRVFV